MSILSRPYFHDEKAAYAKLESLLWPDGPVCSHCGGVEKAYKLNGKTHRIGLYKCGHCRRQFTVKIGTIFESSHVPLHKWLQAIHLMASSKKGISANQLHRTLEVTLKTAWFMGHRIREAMKTGEIDKMGGSGKTIEADETYFGWAAAGPQKGKSGLKRGGGGKRAVVALVERGGSVRSFHVAHANLKTVRDIVFKNVDPKSRFRTDESQLYAYFGRRFASHLTVKHSAGEYVRGDAHTNTIEGFFSIFKRGMKGVYQHCAEKHLHRYLAEFDFRYNLRAALDIDDLGRTDSILRGIVGRRLAYRDS